MSFLEILAASIKTTFPGLLYWLILPMIPFIIAEQLRPVGKAPRLHDYWTNILISLSTAYLSLPLGIAAGLWSCKLRLLLPWRPLSCSFHSIAAIPLIGPGLSVLAMIFVPLLIHDCWFYWSHRIEHKVPLLWEFHKLHHSDDLMNTSTWARDHFLQEGWRAFFSVFTLGLIIDLKMAEAGKAALYSTVFLIGLSMFYHSAIRIELPWLDYILVTPQVHRIHHSVDAEHHNTNFADVLPVFDLVFGTYKRPGRKQFPATGLGSESPTPRSLFAAQLGPLLAVGRLLRPARRDPAGVGSVSD
jgi:sterol desaturase/sphingolipid hydroxylase (fatty acid hydroxylase superfamily)